NSVRAFSTCAAWWRGVNQDSDTSAAALRWIADPHHASQPVTARMHSVAQAYQPPAQLNLSANWDWPSLHPVSARGLRRAARTHHALFRPTQMLWLGLD